MTDSWFPYDLDAERRILRARASIAEATELIDTWVKSRTDRKADAVVNLSFARFGRHFKVLRDTLVPMLTAIDNEIPKPTSSLSPAQAYQLARVAEQRVGKVRQTFGWYTAKYEQREDPERRAVLFAADSIVKSCWETPFARCELPVPTAPLCYLDESFDASATPRRSRPPGIPAGDEVIGSFIKKLPVPVISLPLNCLEQPWFLAVVAHEVGHHVQFDLEPTLQKAASDAAAAAAGPSLAAHWARWSMESFADAWSVLMVGGIAPWLVAQLLAAEPKTMIEGAHSTGLYPPPLVRLALLGELGIRLGVAAPGPSAAEMTALLSDPPFVSLDADALDEHRAHLAVVPDVAAALLDLPVGQSTLCQCSGFDSGLMNVGGTATQWRELLYAEHPNIKESKEEHSARTLAAALGAAVMKIPMGSDESAKWLNHLRVEGLRLMPGFGKEGDLAGEAAHEIDTDRVARELIDDLFKAVN